MSRREWRAVYREAWSLYYSREHMRTVIRRMAASGGPVASLVKLLVRFSTADRLEGVHPLQSGVLRQKHPSERRPGLPRENPLIFWPRYVWQTLKLHALLAGAIGRLAVAAMVITLSSKTQTYTDLALMPVGEAQDEELDLFTKTTGARDAIAHFKKVSKLIHASPAA